MPDGAYRVLMNSNCERTERTDRPNGIPRLFVCATLCIRRGMFACTDSKYTHIAAVDREIYILQHQCLPTPVSTGRRGRRESLCGSLGLCAYGQRRITSSSNCCAGHSGVFHRAGQTVSMQKWAYLTQRERNAGDGYGCFVEIPEYYMVWPKNDRNFEW